MSRPRDALTHPAASVHDFVDDGKGNQIVWRLGPVTLLRWKVNQASRAVEVFAVQTSRQATMATLETGLGARRERDSGKGGLILVFAMHTTVAVEGVLKNSIMREIRERSYVPKRSCATEWRPAHAAVFEMLDGYSAEDFGVSAVRSLVRRITHQHSTSEYRR